MSATLDANLLIYATNAADPRYERATAKLDALVNGPDLLYVFWPVAMAYLRISTHPKILRDPLPRSDAEANLSNLLRAPTTRSVSEGDRFWSSYQRASSAAGSRGNLVPDTHIVALMYEYGVRTIWTSDRDFRKFDDIEVRDPFE